MTQSEIIAILKDKGYTYLAGDIAEVWKSKGGAIDSVTIWVTGDMDFSISNDDGEPMDSFNIENPTPELLKQIL